MLFSLIYFISLLSNANAVLPHGEIEVREKDGFGCPQSNGNFTWKHFNDSSKCLVQMVGAELNFADAEIWCRSLGGHILMPKTVDEIEDARDMLVAPIRHYMWMGLDDLEIEGRYVWADTSLLRKSQTHWEPQAPNNVFGIQHCVPLDWRTGEFDDKHCSSYYLPFLCETTNVNFLQQYEKKQTWCPQGWIHIDCGRFCYWLSEFELNFYDARDKCKDIGGTLAMPKTKRQERAVYLMSSNGEQYRSEWTGWIGLQKSLDGDWKWLDGTRHPTADLFHKEDCVYTRWDGEQYSAPCSQDQGFICQKLQTNWEPTDCVVDDEEEEEPKEQLSPGVTAHSRPLLMMAAFGLCQLIFYL